MNNTSNTGLKISDNTAEKIGSIICGMLENVNTNWQQPWVSVCMQPAQSLVAKRAYNGMNAFLLSLLVDMMGYKTPYFLTMKNVSDLGLRLNKCKVTDKKTGEEKEAYESPFPVMFWTSGYTNGKKYITKTDYDTMQDEEQASYHGYWTLKVYNVWNIDQTNYAEVFPDKYEKLREKNSMPQNTYEEDCMNAVLDYEIAGGEWRCPIRFSDKEEAYYKISKDEIMLPSRNRFNSASAFYGTALHEMSHSTGVKECLNRLKPTSFGTTEYAKEELVAELSAAIVLHDLGVEKYMKEDSLPYIQTWCKVLKDPQAVKKVMGDVMACVSYHKKAYAAAEHKLNVKESAQAALSGHKQ